MGVHRGNYKEKWNRIWGIAAAVLFLASICLQAAARWIPGFGEWYGRWIYPALVTTVGRLWGFLSFSVSEIGIYLLMISCIVYGILNRRQWLSMLLHTWFLLSLIFFLFTVNCGINYYRLPFSTYSGLKVKDHSTEDLVSLCRFLTGKVNETAGKRRELLRSEMLLTEEAGEQGVKAMEKLGAAYPELSGFYPKPKPVLFSRILSVQQLSGIYSPFIIEANYNREMTSYNIPHTICHELSHLKGFMREDEANFIGYLACTGSDSILYQYSGYLSGWIYAGNALAKADLQTYYELLDELDEMALADLRENNSFWDRFDTKAAEISNQMNDAYLKLNSQEDGVKSYGRVVDLMLAYYFHETTP